MTMPRLLTVLHLFVGRLMKIPARALNLSRDFAEGAVIVLIGGDN